MDEKELEAAITTHHKWLVYKKVCCEEPDIESVRDKGEALVRYYCNNCAREGDWDKTPEEAARVFSDAE